MLDLSRRRRGAVLLALATALGGTPAGARSPRHDWANVAGPSDGPARVVGGHGWACITGAVPLALEGQGYQTVDIGRRRYFGHPDLIDFIGALGRSVGAADLGLLLVGDMAQPRGGPMSSGHVSHQGGLDVDLWFRLDVPPLPRAQREGLAQPSVVDPVTGRPDPARWTDRHRTLVRLAAVDPRVSRVFVGAAIKRDLCAHAGTDRQWLRVVRPWPGHDDHLHVRLRCPPDSPACSDQPPPPIGEGCTETDLAPWFARERAARGRPAPVPRRAVPAACHALLSAESPGRVQAAATAVQP